jgi:hypothetical protein
MEDLILSDPNSIAEQNEILRAKLVIAEEHVAYFKEKYMEISRTLQNSNLGKLSYSKNGQPLFLYQHDEEAIKKIITLIIKGTHMEVLEEAAKKDDNVNTAWRNLAIFLRLSGGDNSSTN